MHCIPSWSLQKFLQKMSEVGADVFEKEYRDLHFGDSKGNTGYRKQKRVYF